MWSIHMRCTPRCPWLNANHGLSRRDCRGCYSLPDRARPVPVSSVLRGGLAPRGNRAGGLVCGCGGW